MTPKRSFPLAVLALLACLAFAGCGSSSAPSKPKLSDKAVDRVLSASYRQVVGFTPAQLNARTTSVQKQLASCVSKVAAVSQSDKTAGSMLANELDLQYTMATSAPMYQTLASMDAKLAALPFTAKLRTGLKTTGSETLTALRLDTCADLAAWKRAKFAENKIPTGTVFVATLVDNKSSLVPAITVTDSNQALKALAEQARTTINTTGKASAASFNAWLKKIA